MAYLICYEYGFRVGQLHFCQTQDGLTALMIACQKGQAYFVRFLLEGGANKDVKSNVRAINCICAHSLFFYSHHFLAGVFIGRDDILASRPVVFA
jgi:hypothetical protein